MQSLNPYNVITQRKAKKKGDLFFDSLKHEKCFVFKHRQILYIYGFSERTCIL